MVRAGQRRSATDHSIRSFGVNVPSGAAARLQENFAADGGDQTIRREPGKCFPAALSELVVASEGTTGRLASLCRRQSGRDRT
jgi:hypothetical protein